MKNKIIMGLLILVYSCNHQGSNGKQMVENESHQKQMSSSGLLFEFDRYRGTEYTDSLGIKYNLRYRPITISNTSDNSYNIQFSFLKEYVHDNESFRIFPLPREWGKAGGNWDVMWKEFPRYLDNPKLNETIKPGEKTIVAIGELLARPPQISINIVELFEHDKEGTFPTCEWIVSKHISSNSKINLGLKLDFSESCTIIPCGSISYLKN